MPVDPLSYLESSKPENVSWFSYFLKPIIILFVIIVLGYVTMWMSLNYVKQDQFTAYVEQQIETNKKQDAVYLQRFDMTQSKLETIIHQQVAYGEQLKAYNQLMLGVQKQVDDIDDRVKYMERTKIGGNNR